MEISDEQYKRLMHFMEWSIETFLWQNKQTGLDIPPSPDLTDAINLKAELEKNVQNP